MAENEEAAQELTQQLVETKSEYDIAMIERKLKILDQLKAR